MTGDDHANGGSGTLNNGVIGRPVIADPELTEVNQAYVSYQGVPKLAVDAGRIEMALGDERFVHRVDELDPVFLEGKGAEIATPRRFLLVAHRSVGVVGTAVSAEPERADPQKIAPPEIPSTRSAIVVS